MSSIDPFSRYPNPHTAGCPWFDIAHNFGSPNLKWCEETLCQWISEPANTWSSVGYVLVAIHFWWQWKNHPFLPLRLAPWTILIMGLCSFVYHLSNTYLTQLLDYLGMFLCLYNILWMNLHRLFPMRKKPFVTSFFFIVILTLFLTHLAYLQGAFIQTGVGFILLGVLATEIWCIKKNFGAKKYHHYVLALVYLSIAATCGYMDLSPNWCNPYSHWVQGHAFWHFFTALMTLYIYKFYQELWLDRKIKNLN